MTIYTLKLEVRSPVHIGSGKATLKPDIDYWVVRVRNHNRTYRLNAEQILDTILPDPQENPQLFEQILASRNLASFIRLEDLENNETLWRYWYGGQPNGKAREIRPYVADIHGLPYMPGSALKGALRTVWVRSMFEYQGSRLNISKLKDDPRYAFQTIEQLMMSGNVVHEKTANYDLFRAVQVADSTSADRTSSTIANTRVWPAGKKGIPIVVEALDVGATLMQRVKFDPYLLENKKVVEKLEWQGKAEQLQQELWELCRQQGRQRIEQERTFWAARSGASQVENFYKQLAHDAASDEHFYIELGWGTGWKSKTIGGIIRDDHTIAQLISRYKLGKGHYAQIRSFPKTRSVVVDDRDIPRMPMGWVKVTVEEMR